MLCNVYSTPEALHNRKLTQKLVNVKCILFKDTIYTCSDAHLQLNKPILNQSVIIWCSTLKWVGVFWLQWRDTILLLYLMWGRHSETIWSSQLQSQTVQYDCYDIGLISTHNTMYALNLIFIQDPNKTWFIRSYYQKLYFLAVAIGHILMCWSSFVISKFVKREARGGRGVSDTLSCVALTATVASSASLQQQTQSLLPVSCTSCEGVLLLPSSCPFRAFYDCTLIVEALFYTESYFRIQYVLLYIKCIVWIKLNKCCLKTNISLSLNPTLTFCWVCGIVVWFLCSGRNIITEASCLFIVFDHLPSV